ncbi:crossover junction endodeoxyribonuclease RuvC [Microcella flavibacter]|uniref:crossover junction endodeoxyribonuclease RuvC n=1 Tax=Microcella flavibacter TaxID=1804990 RepID=UPI001456AB66|nr:crossover junction endodeoxyribonuclease RuvC [Microcella flavibacter]
MALRVLGVDPGLTRCGVGVVDIAPDRGATLVHVSVIRTDPATPLEQRVLAIAEGVAALLDEHAPHVVALERVFAQNNVRTVMGTAQASGVVLSAAAARGLAVALHTPSEVKAAVTGHGGADKKQVSAMVQRILRLDAPPTPADAADALALAICHGWRRAAVAPAGVAGPDQLTPAQRAWRAAEKSAAAPRVEG